MGCVYKPQRSPYWWIKFYVNGRAQYESTRTTNRQAAGRVLKDREGRVVRGEPMLLRVDRVPYDQVAQELRTHYQTTGCRNLVEADKRLAHLDRHFTGWRVPAIDAPAIATYTATRQAEGAANGTINRELAVLRRMLGLAAEHGRALRVPRIRRLKEAPPRAGFFEAERYAAVRRHLRPDLQVACDLAYTYGWRICDEVLPLERRQLDLDAGTIRLDAGATKNDDGRVVYLTPELTTALTAQLDRVRAVERTLGRIIPVVFPHLTGRRLAGRRIKNFRKAWATACRTAGCVGMLRHDFRRTAVRNLVNAGVPERVAMTITGHKTRSVFDRYHIVSPGDLQDAARKLEAAAEGAMVRRTVIPMAAGRE